MTRSPGVAAALLLFLLLASARPGAAQVQGPQVAQTWREGFPMRWVPEARRLEWEAFDRKGRVATRSVILPEGPQYSLGWGELWRIDAQLGIARSADGIRWVPEGKLVAERRPLHGVPLGPGCLLAAGFRGPLELGEAAGAMGIYRQDGAGAFRLESLVLPFEEPLYVREGKDWIRNRKVGHFELHTLGLQVLPLRALPEGALLVSLQGGRPWQFDAKGRLLRSPQLFDRPREADWPDVLRFEPVLLGLQVTAEGRVLAVSRTREAVVEARRAHPVMVREEGRLRFAGDAVTGSENQVQAGFRFPALLWWEWDPGEGGFRRLENPPPGSPASLPGSPEETQAWIQSFTFLLSRSGEVRLLKPGSP